MKIEQAIKEKKNLLSTLEVEKQQLQNSEPKIVDVTEAVERNEKYISLKKEIALLEESLRTNYTPADVSEYTAAKKVLQYQRAYLQREAPKRKTSAPIRGRNTGPFGGGRNACHTPDADRGQFYADVLLCLHRADSHPHRVYLHIVFFTAFFPIYREKRDFSFQTDSFIMNTHSGLWPN